MIIRVDHKRNYTVLANGALRDGRLSFRATGVLAYVLSLPDEAELNGLALAAAKSEGRDALLVALKELEVAGYLVREKRQDPTTGHWHTCCTVRESGGMAPGNPQPGPGFQGPENRPSVFQASKDFEVLEPSTEIGAPPPASPSSPRPPADAEEKARILADLRRRRGA